ncbi:hypothetical protein AND4_04965 [Vibrio sp. AND4]|nr:hypothetical protein AND4_04965 [Vibrio sp. AND4]
MEKLLKMGIAVFFFLTLSWPPKERSKFLNRPKSFLIQIIFTSYIHIAYMVVKTNFAAKNIQMELISFLKKYDQRQNSIYVIELTVIFNNKDLIRINLLELIT